MKSYEHVPPRHPNKRTLTQCFFFGGGGVIISTTFGGKVQVSGCCLGLRVEGLGFRVQGAGLGFQVESSVLRFRVQGLGFKEPPPGCRYAFFYMYPGRIRLRVCTGSCAH